jgi:hypothetical protein
LATTLNLQPRRDVSLDARTWFCLAPKGAGARVARPGGYITCAASRFGSIVAMNHYRFYELDHSDHI